MVTPPDTPTCRIKGIIRSVAFEAQRTTGPGRDDEDGPLPPGAVQGSTYPAEYRLLVLVQEVSFASGGQDSETCEDRYAAGEEIPLYVYASEVGEGDAFEEGQVIEGHVWNGYFKTHSLAGRKR